METSLFAPFVVTIDRAAGALIVDLAPFVIRASSEFTHFKIISAGTEIDFEAETFVVTNSKTAILP